MLLAVIRRVVATFPVLVGALLITFFSIRLIPGDAVTLMLGEFYTEESAAALRSDLGLDKDIITQFVIWLGGVLRGDFGESLVSHVPVSTLIGQRIGPTLILTLSALVVSLLIAIPAGVYAGARKGGSFDAVARIASVAGISLPSFVIGVGLILLFAVQLRILPSGGYPRDDSSVLLMAQHLVLPTVSLAASATAITLKMTRTSYIGTSRLDYVRTARAKGLSNLAVSNKHILRNSLLPVVTVVGIQVGYLLGGSIIVEQVFSWPGIGSLLIRAILQRDYPVIQAVILLTTVLFVLCNLIADLLYLVLDPRLRDG